MSAVQAQIDEIEKEMARTQKNKATNYHLGTLKAKLAKLRSELINGPGGKSAGSKDAGRGFEVTRSGDTRVGLVGFPSVGKSTLLTTLTGTRSEAAAYEFTTLTCIPGTMKCEERRSTRYLSTVYLYIYIFVFSAGSLDCLGIADLI